MICPICQKQLTIGGQHTFSERGFENDNDGLVTNALCENEKCEISLVELYHEIKCQN